KGDGDKLFKKARELDEQGAVLFKELLIGNEELTEYYQKPCLGFVFSKEILEELLAKMILNQDYIVLLTGAKEGGRRTMMAFVYKTCGEDICLDTTVIKNFAGKIGTQHPGIVRKVDEKNKYDVPVVISKGDMEA
ncbi:MAG: hypothetical protein ACXWCT_15850, partial [Flavitalea sp.]